MSCLGGVVALLAALFSEEISAVQWVFAECQGLWGKTYHPQSPDFRLSHTNTQRGPVWQKAIQSCEVIRRADHSLTAS
jgi:hypothetical protein